MIDLAHRVFPYVEGHKFYCEHWYTNLFFNKIREFGELLSEQGFFAKQEDVFQLTHYELESGDHRPDAVLVERLAAARRLQHWPPIVAERRAAIAAMGEERHAAGAGADAGDHRRPGHRDAVGHHAREPGQLAVRRRRRGQQRGARLCCIIGRGRRYGAHRQVGGGDLAPAAGRHPRLPGDEPDLGAHLPEDPRRGVRHRRLDEPCGDSRARIRPAGVVGTGNATTKIKDGQRMRGRRGAAS